MTTSELQEIKNDLKVIKDTVVELKIQQAVLDTKMKSQAGFFGLLGGIITGIITSIITLKMGK